MLLRQIWLRKGHAAKLFLVPVVILMAGAAYTSVLIGEQQQALQRVLYQPDELVTDRSGS
jgi:hypothetical protein